MSIPSPAPNNRPASFHDLGEQIEANITGGAFHNFLDAALLGKLLIVLAAADLDFFFDHLQQLLASYQVVQYYDIFVVRN